VFLHRCKWRIGDGNSHEGSVASWGARYWLHSSHSQGVYNMYVNQLMVDDEKKVEG
jgi:hypothetical protein